MQRQPLTIKEAAACLKVSQDTIRRAIKATPGVAFTVGTQWRIWPENLDKLSTRNKISPAGTAGMETNKCPFVEEREAHSGGLPSQPQVANELGNLLEQLTGKRPRNITTSLRPSSGRKRALG